MKNQSKTESAVLIISDDANVILCAPLLNQWVPCSVLPIPEAIEYLGSRLRIERAYALINETGIDVSACPLLPEGVIPSPVESIRMLVAKISDLELTQIVYFIITNPETMHACVVYYDLFQTS